MPIAGETPVYNADVLMHEGNTGVSHLKYNKTVENNNYAHDWYELKNFICTICTQTIKKRFLYFHIDFTTFKPVIIP